MNKTYILIIVSTLVLSGALSACCAGPEPDVPIYTYTPDSGKPAENTETSPPLGAAPPAAQQTEAPGEDHAEHNVVVDEHNNVFPIGIPAGNTEKTEVTAQQPINFWFEYLTADATLEINGVEVKRDPYTFETKIGYTESVTKFNYQIINPTGGMISYNLHLVPSASGTKVSVKVDQRWIKTK